MIMNETGSNNEELANWHPPEEPKKPSRFGRTLGAVNRFKDAATEAAAGQFAKGMKAARNFDTEAVLTAAQAAVDSAATVGKDLAGRGAEVAINFKDSAIKTFEGERFRQLTATLQEVLTSPEARKVLEKLPFARGIVKIIEGGVGTTMERESLSVFGRMKKVVGGGKDLAVDTLGGEAIKGAKILQALINAGPDILSQVGHALKAREVKGAETIAALASFMQEHPTIINFLSGKLPSKR